MLEPEHFHHELEFISVELVNPHAVLLHTKERMLWVPIHEVRLEDRDRYARGDGPGAIRVTTWWAKKRGIL